MQNIKKKKRKLLASSIAVVTLFLITTTKTVPAEIAVICADNRTFCNNCEKMSGTVKKCLELLKTLNQAKTTTAKKPKARKLFTSATAVITFFLISTTKTAVICIVLKAI